MTPTQRSRRPRPRGRSWRYPAIVLVLAALAAAGPAQGRGPVRSLLEMRQENVVIQQWDLSCGAAALTTLLRYQHGDDVTERTVARALIGRDEYLDHPELVKLRQGFSLLDLKRYVDARQYLGVGYGKLALDDLVERAPLMVPISTHGYNHFVIFRGLRGNRVLLADPAWGNRTMTVERFRRLWLELPELGHVGFVVQRADGGTPVGRLAPRDGDFVTLR